MNVTANKVACGDPQIFTTDNTTTYTSSYTYQGMSYPTYIPKPVNNEEIFKQITSLLGIKIINVSIQSDVVTLHGRRNRKKFIIEITVSYVYIKSADGSLLSEISLCYPSQYVPYTQSGTSIASIGPNDTITT